MSELILDTAQPQESSSLLDRLGIPRPLALGFLGTLLFMIGDGVESGYLSPYLISRGLSAGQVALMFTIYGFVAALSAWCSGALSDLWGPRQVMLIRSRIGSRPLAKPGEKPIATLLSSITIAWKKPKTAIGCIVRTINPAPEIGFLVFLPIFFTQTIGFSLGAWLRLLSFMFLSNIIWNLLFGIIGDKLGWRQTVAYCGGIGCAITTLLLYYVPLASKDYSPSILVGVLYGVTLAGYVPLSALMPS